MTSVHSLVGPALDVLERNDTGLFVKPGPRVYPFQWNWDSAFVALGLACVDPERGRREVRSLLRGRWADGMVPHIVFHDAGADYSPGPEIWGSADCAGAPRVATSGLTQPPVLATAVRALHEADADREFLEEVLPGIDAWHRWLERDRSFDDSGLVAIVHPWESADNAPRFDAALARIDPSELAFARSDRKHLADDERPTDRRVRALPGNRRSACASAATGPRRRSEAPFAYVDLAFNAILAVAGRGPRVPARRARWRRRTGGRPRGASAYGSVRTLGRDRRRVPAARPARRGRDVGDDRRPVPAVRRRPRRSGRPASCSQRSLWSPERFGPSEESPWAVTTVSKSSAAFDPRRYWRGPVWINVNWFLVRGLRRCGLADEAEELRLLTLRLLETSGFAEYYDPRTGEALGSGDFSWSAALALDLLA